MHDLALQVDPELTPDAFLANTPVALLAPTHWTQAGNAYRKVLKRIGKQHFDTVLLVPWLKRGGADLAALHHAHACQQAFGHRTLVIATELGESPWACRLPEEVLFVQIGSELSSLSKDLGEAEILLARLLIQIAPTRIHLINSRAGWRTMAKFGKALGQKSRLFASLYCDERAPSGARIGLAQEYLPSTYRWLDGIITDNSISPQEWVNTLGITPEIFHVVHFPAPQLNVVTKPDQIAPKQRLLWASRFERQKRPQLLVELAKLTPDFHWDVYGEPLSHSDHEYRALQQLSNVTLHGKYEQFNEIVRPDHLALVYTTAWDGLPNVILEAAASDLPIIAPDVGGIRDLVPEYALLPTSPKPSDYIASIGKLASSEHREKLMTEQKHRVQQFTFERFCKQLAAMEGYSTP